MNQEQRTFYIYILMCLIIIFLTCSRKAYESFCLCPKGGVFGKNNTSRDSQRDYVKSCQYSSDFIGVL